MAASHHFKYTVSSIEPNTDSRKSQNLDAVEHIIGFIRHAPRPMDDMQAEQLHEILEKDSTYGFVRGLCEELLFPDGAVGLSRSLGRRAELVRGLLTALSESEVEELLAEEKMTEAPMSALELRRSTALDGMAAFLKAYERYEDGSTGEEAIIASFVQLARSFLSAKQKIRFSLEWLVFLKTYRGLLYGDALLSGNLLDVLGAAEGKEG